MTRTVASFSLMLSFLAGASWAAAEDELAGRASWSVMPAAAVKTKLDAYLASVKPTEAQKQQIDQVWPAAPANADPAKVDN